MTVPDFENKELEKLAIMVARGFDAVDKRFEDVDKRFDHIESRIDTVETEIHNGFRSVNERIDKLQEVQIPLPEQDELWQRIKRIEKHLGLPHDLQTA
jgi:tetrahydromethanopterin S-methyltransferase subunit G